MNFYPTKFIVISFLFFLLSCSADTDLFEEAIAENIEENINENIEEQQSKTVFLSPINDAYLENGERFNDEIIRLEPDLRTSYLMFDLSELKGKLENAELVLTVTDDAGDGIIRVYKGSHNDWTEENISVENAPKLESVISTLSGSYLLGMTETLNLAKAYLDSDKLSIVLRQETGNDIALASKENNSEDGPLLKITYIPSEISISEEIDEEDSVEEFSEKIDELKAFPSAYGAGSDASGGRGYPVIKVTNLKDSGPGSLREALSGGNRTIVFTVSGIINLKSAITVSGDNITIAGQTAPSGGIAISGTHITNRIIWRGNNAIIRYIKFRPVFDPQGIVDGVDFSGNENIIIDHCSFAWGGDEVISFVGSLGNQPDNITFQRNIIYKGWKGSIYGYSRWYDDGQVERPTGDFSYNNNLVAHTSHRMPGFATDDRFDIINNVIHNWFERITVMNRATGSEVNWMNNYVQGGCFDTNPNTKQFKFNAVGYDPSLPTPLIYVSGNFYDEFPSASQESLFRYWSKGKPPKETGDQLDAEFFVNSAYPQITNSFEPLTAQEAKLNLTNGGAGAVWRLDLDGNRVEDIDILDSAAISDVANNVCVPYTYREADWQNSAEYSNYRSTISESPISVHPMDYDADNDGMPDIWETSVFGNLSRDGRGDLNGNGYTDLEEYLNLIDL